MSRIRIASVLVVFIFLFAIPAMALDLKELQAEIKAKGADWTAGETSMSKIPLEEFASYCNLIIEFPKDVKPYTPAIPKDMPAHLDWRDVNGQDFTTPIKDQHPCGSCASFASTGALEILLKIALNNPFMMPDLSEQHVYSCANPIPYTFITTLGVLKSQGDSDEACFPYDCDTPDERPPCNNKCADWANRSFKTDGHQMMMYPNPEQMKAALQSGPIVAGMQVYEDFRYYTGGVYEHTSGGLLGGHGVVVVGYDDAEQYWICKNSWGTEWGEEGWFKIRWGDGGLTPFGYQSFIVSVSYPTLCGANLPPTISALTVLNQNPKLAEDESLLITFAFEDANANLAGGELFYSIDGAVEVRYEEPLTQMVSTSSYGQEQTVFTIPAPFGSGEHTISLYVKDLCGVASNPLVGSFAVEGETVDDDAEDDDDSSGSGGCGC